MKMNSSAGGAGASGKANPFTAAAESATRQNGPTERKPVGTLTNSTPEPTEWSIRNEPSADVDTT